MFKRYYVVRYGTASLSLTPRYRLVKAYSRKNAYKSVKKTLPARYLVTDIIRVRRKVAKNYLNSFYEADKRYDI